jgi:2-(1,2-epoxy-1,2-dihydrophenyl)acetyl-CoA isomerase
MTVVDRGLVVERRAGADWLRLDRPERLNAFDWPLRDAILDAIERCRTNDASGLVITGTGRGFCVGADVHDILASDRDVDLDERRRRLERSHDLIVALRELGKPTFAAVNGVAAGGGWAMALATETVVAVPSARFVTAFARLGLVPDMGAMYLLRERVGVARAIEVFLARQEVHAVEALSMGAVDWLVPEHRLDDAVTTLLATKATS